MRAFYSASLTRFLVQDTASIVGELTQSAAQAGQYQQLHTQTDAWASQICILQTALVNFGSGGHLFFEYIIPRRGKRADAILLLRDLIFVIEFKIGSHTFSTSDIAQVEDYALDLRDFHLASRGRVVVPVLVATNARYARVVPRLDEGQLPATQLSNAEQLEQILLCAIDRYSNSENPPIDATRWEHSEYRPTPTIIEIAQALYAGQDVQEISRSHAGATNLTLTTQAVLRQIDQAKSAGEKVICFVTGVPGAGKTLAGLNIVHNRELDEENLGVFLSGNGPLVKVLSEALARDYAEREGVSRQESRRRVRTFIQNVHHFLDHYFHSEERPADRVVVFDEAQRAWDAAQSELKFNRPFSEPEMMLEIMDRHDGWATVVALIGGGQEINRGEAGLSEWGRILQDKFPHWRIAISPALLTGDHSTASQVLFPYGQPNLAITCDPDLHLAVSIRAYRAERLSEFVGYLLDNQPQRCRDLLKTELGDYPLYITRDLSLAQAWLRAKKIGTRRYGMIASSGARRLKAYGYDVARQIDVANWFLNSERDVRSSYYLEDIATEFDIQGLELDWLIIGWGGDFRYIDGAWDYRRFVGTEWTTVHQESTQTYIKNKYRVLLTRAREGLVIWIPPGDSGDWTREPSIYDETAAYLTQCGIPTLTAFPRRNE
ncbi:MAG: DUF2075 domain-containing protein [Chloroflexi bacterium]|jgi:hypothetical protein|nr:DUF2075 domain-containing protein [Chloroflexota bacterium]